MDISGYMENIDEKLIKTHRIYRKKLLKMTKEAIISYLNCLIVNSKTQKY